MPINWDLRTPMAQEAVANIKEQNQMADADDHAKRLVHELEGIHEWDEAQHDFMAGTDTLVWCEVCSFCGIYRCEVE